MTSALFYPAPLTIKTRLLPAICQSSDKINAGNIVDEIPLYNCINEERKKERKEERKKEGSRFISPVFSPFVPRPPRARPIFFSPFCFPFRRIRLHPACRLSRLSIDHLDDGLGINWDDLVSGGYRRPSRKRSEGFRLHP